ncbi:hypothetical protein CI41S_68010 [Bradyrhizobium ivorense]|nr:hypothetical protein CI41S_68010 [Bradyrhizobium ivorense]
MKRPGRDADLRSRNDRLSMGKALRRSVPREAHAELRIPGNRSALAILKEGDVDRVKTLLPLRYKRMAESPFAYLRGAAAVMAHDLALGPMTGLTVQACGDGHLMNFGALVTPEGNIAFDVNDFDETLDGIDFTVDLKRLAASAAVAALNAGFSAREARSVAEHVASAYRKRMRILSMLSPAEIWHSRIDLENEIERFGSRALRHKLRTTVDRAKGSGLSKDDNFPHLVRKRHRIADKCPTIFHFDQMPPKERPPDPKRLFENYRDALTPDRSVLLDRYRMRDIVFKAVGVGSVGTFCCVALFLTADDEPLFLQIKQAQRSAMERVDPNAAYDGNQGRRVVEGQRKMQAASDIFLGFSHDSASRREFYVRTLKNRRLGGVGEIAEPEALYEYAALCARTLARAHARSGEPAKIAGYIGRSAIMDRAIASFAMAYADQTVTDHDELVRSRRSGPTRRGAK